MPDFEQFRRYWGSWEYGKNAQPIRYKIASGIEVPPDRGTDEFSVALIRRDNGSSFIIGIDKIFASPEDAKNAEINLILQKIKKHERNISDYRTMIGMIQEATFEDEK